MNALLVNIGGRQFDLGRPARYDVLQFGGIQLSGLLSLQDEFDVGCMPTVGERLNLHVLFRMLLGFRVSRWHYYRHYIRATQARVILVWHDTSIEAFQLWKYIRIPVFCIQNGVRHNVSPANGNGFLTSLDNLKDTRAKVGKYFVFDASTHALLANRIETEFVTSGSFRLNNYVVERESSINQTHPAVRLGFIVSFPNSSDVPGGSIADNAEPFVRVEGLSVSYSQYFEPEIRIAEILLECGIELGYTVDILGKRSSTDDIESRYFSELATRHNLRVVSHDKGAGYLMADSYDVLITVDSTLGHEMLAIGKRVGFISNRFRMIGIDSKEMTFGSPLGLPADGPFWTSATEREGIRNFLRTFIPMTDSEWQKARQKYSDVIMTVDPGNQILKHSIRHELSRH